MRTVAKVGGSVLGGASDLIDLARNIAERRAAGEEILLVTSALRGVTDLLERGLWRVRAGVADRSCRGVSLVAELWRRHSEVAASLGGGERLLATLRCRVDEVAALLTRAAGDEMSRADQARLLSYGERLSAPLVAAAVRAAGADARAIDSEEAGLRAGGALRSGRCDLAASRSGVAALAAELSDRVLVVTGFYGVREHGDVVLFGRGGSDYSASVLAALLSPTRMELWKDVPGVFTANPKRVPAARLVRELSYAEASALGGFGARILHPHCLAPLRGRPISAVVGAGIEPISGRRSRGTVLVEARRDPQARAAALAVKAPRTVVRVTGGSLSAESRAAGRMLDDLGEDGFLLDTVAVSKATLCFSIVDDRPYEASRMLRSLNGHRPGRVQIRQFPAWLGVVGDRVAANGAAQQILHHTLDAVGIRAEIERPRAEGTVLRCRLERDELAPLLVALHERLFAAP